MKKVLGILGLLVLFSGCERKTPNRALEQWLGTEAAARPALSGKDFATVPLAKEEAQQAEKVLWQDYCDSVRTGNRKAWEEKCLEHNSLSLRFDYKVFGEEPRDGRSLYISMHGGGNTATAVNDQQWNNQIRLYQPREGVYLAPRAPWDDWNMWFKPGIDALFDELIQTAVAVMGVDPDKVYLMGYSAGGDGVYRLAPRMADRWAAAAMMAGHPGEASMLNLRNLPFTLWMGEQDAAYNRNRLAVERGGVLDSLHRADTGGYVHEIHIVPGKGHWMERQDSAAVEWMAQYRRNPLPDRIVWRQEEVTHPSFYWLAVPGEECVPGATLIVERQGNHFDIQTSDYKKLTIRLNDKLADLDQPVSVTYRGKVLYRGIPERTILTLYRTLMERGDSGLVFCSEITVNLQPDDLTE